MASKEERARAAEAARRERISNNDFTDMKIEVESDKEDQKQRRRSLDEHDD